MASQGRTTVPAGKPTLSLNVGFSLQSFWVAKKSAPTISDSWLPRLGSETCSELSRTELPGTSWAPGLAARIELMGVVDGIVTPLAGAPFAKKPSSEYSVTTCPANTVGWPSARVAAAVKVCGI